VQVACNLLEFNSISLPPDYVFRLESKSFAKREPQLESQLAPCIV